MTVLLYTAKNLLADESLALPAEVSFAPAVVSSRHPNLVQPVIAAKELGVVTLYAPFEL